jgi:hypothetical protein
MVIHSITRALQVAFLFSAACFAQTTTPPDPPAAPCPVPMQAPGQSPNQTPDKTAKPCPPAPAAKKPSAAEQFPFPGEPAKPANPPDSPSPTTTPSDAASQHPFPTQPPPKLPGDDSSSSSSSSDGDSSGADPDMPKPGTEGSSVHRKLPKVQRVQTDDERVDEDIKVAKFYMNDENYPGAYLRAKDAVKVQPDYSLGHFTLAQVAQKMKKKDEAMAEYQTYLKLDPEGEKAKAAQKALVELRLSDPGKVQ